MEYFVKKINNLRQNKKLYLQNLTGPVSLCVRLYYFL